MISKVPVFDNGPDSVTTTISTHGYNPDLAQESPYIQAVYAVILSLSKQVAL
ncbi:hypothetical protein KA037_03895 [Patescibacteria group bacterium]|nr:hypothetical protein [Patescibacteria group bacterium]MBP7841783.1 hypothetical protein [Patescibacteria group bacterium]